jgi:glycosyltransferase involved in cell wall biosynthesis
VLSPATNLVTHPVPERGTVVRGICMLTADIDSPTGGVQAQSLRLLRELASRGISASVCTRNYSHLARNEIRETVRIHRSPVWRREFRVMNSAAYLADSLAWLLRNRDTYEVVHCQQMFGPATAALVAKPWVKKPVIVRVSSTGELGEVANLRRIAFSSLRLRQLKDVDYWVALTNLMATEIMSLGVPADRITVIPNAAVIPDRSATDAETRAHYRHKLGLDYPRIVVYSGRLSSEKNLDVLLQAWAQVVRRYDRARLLLAGAGGAFRNVETQLREQQRVLGIGESVRFLGHVANVTEYLLASDLFVLPTSTEGMSNSLLEAMAAGTAIITTDIEANREVVANGVDALLVPPRDAQALAKAIVRVFGSSELAAGLGCAARETARTRHSVAAMTDAYLSVYARVLSENR